MELPFAKGLAGNAVSIQSQFINRHGLIAGATGTGKTISLQVLAEQFSLAGVPVFMADVKGDLSGVAKAGVISDKLSERLNKRGMSAPNFQKFPVLFWDVEGQKGHPVRMTLSELGSLLLSQLLDLNETQTSVMQILFKIADDSNLLLLDLKDLESLLKLVNENIEKFKPDYGHISNATLGAIQRNLLTLKEEVGEKLFGETALDVHDLLQKDKSGKGYIHILVADKLIQAPKKYSTLLLWLLSELFEELPEVGDQVLPKLVFFFDEAHLLFQDAPKVLQEKIEQVVRLIRSKGVGIYFVTQSPSDVPEKVLGQLSNRVQHALRAFTPQDAKAVKIAAQTFRPNPTFSTEEAISQLAVGEALVSFLDSSGTPQVVDRAFVFPPQSQIGPLNENERKDIIQSSPIAGHYERVVDRESAFEIIAKQNTIKNAPAAKENLTESSPPKNPSVLNEILFGSVGPRGGRKAGVVEKVATSVVRSVASDLGRSLLRGVLGSFTGQSGRKRR